MSNDVTSLLKIFRWLCITTGYNSSSLHSSDSLLPLFSYFSSAFLVSGQQLKTTLVCKFNKLVYAMQVSFSMVVLGIISKVLTFTPVQSCLSRTFCLTFLMIVTFHHRHCLYLQGLGKGPKSSKTYLFIMFCKSFT